MACRNDTASRVLIAVLTLLATGLCGRADTDATAKSPVPETEVPASVAAEPHVPPSVPALPPIARDPFWPVGFDPNPSAAPVVSRPNVTPQPAPPPVKLPEPGPDDWAAARRQLKPNVGHSVTPDGSERFFAFMNNRLITVGQPVKAKTPLFNFTWRIARIDDNGVAFTPTEAKRLSDGARFAPPPLTND